MWTFFPTLHIWAFGPTIEHTGYFHKQFFNVENECYVYFNPTMVFF